MPSNIMFTLESSNINICVTMDLYTNTNVLGQKIGVATGVLSLFSVSWTKQYDANCVFLSFSGSCNSLHLQINQTYQTPKTSDS